MPAPFILAFDLGAPKIAAAAFDFDGERRCSVQRLPAMAKHPPVLTLMNVKRTGAQAIKWAGFEGPAASIAMAAPAPFDPERGRLGGSARLPGLEGFDLAGFLRKEFGAPLQLALDAACFALGEARAGAAQGARRTIGVRILGSRAFWGMADAGRIVDREGGEIEFETEAGSNDSEAWSRRGAQISAAVESCSADAIVISGAPDDAWEALEKTPGPAVVKPELGPAASLVGAASHALELLRQAP